MPMILRTLGASFLYLLSHVVANATEIDLQRREAGHAATSTSRLRQLAQSSDWQIRQIIARNRKAPHDLLYKLASDPHPQVRIGVATNLKTDEKPLY